MRLKPNNCCAIVIDYQEKLVPAINKKEELIENSVKLLRGLSMLEIPMVLTEQYPKGLGDTLPEIKEAAKGSPIVAKTTFSALENDDVLGYLEQLEEIGRNQVLICGIEGHICVLQTALQLLKRDFQPIFVTDCISSRHASDYMTAMMRAEREGVQFATTEMVLFELIGGKDHPKFKAISALVK